MNKILTAEEFSENYTWTCCPEKDQVLEAMIEFAKLHVEAALKEASEKVKTKTHEEYISKYGEYEYSQYPDKDSILNAYPLTNIK